MKKLVFLLVCLFSIQTMLWADNDKPIHVGQLPTKAQILRTIKSLWLRWSQVF